jgi:hypothetical protein
VPPGFAAWFERAVAREPDKRFQSARELGEALRAVLLQPGLLPPDVPKLPPLPLADTQRGLATSRTLALPVKRGRRVLVGVMLGCLTGSIVLGFLIWRDRTHRREAASVISVDERTAGASATGASATGTSSASAVAATPPEIATPAPVAIDPVPDPAAVADSAPSSTPSAAAHAQPVHRPMIKPRAPRSEPGKDPRLGF